MSTSTNTTDVPFDPFAGLPSLDNIYGAGLVGTSVGLMLFGLTVHQVYRYFRLYPNDRIYIKIYVVTLLLVEAFHIIISLHTCYFYLVTNYLSKTTAFLVPVWSVNTVPLATGVVAALSQGFFAYRVFMVGPNYRFVVFGAMILILAEVAFSLAATIETYVRPTFNGFSGVTWIWSTSFGIAVLIDVILTGILIYVLRTGRSQALKRTNATIDLLIIYSINTGLLTGIFNTLTFIFALVYPDNLIYGAFAVVTAKLYANSVLAAINTRQSLRHGQGEIELDTFGISFAARASSSGYTGDIPETHSKNTLQAHGTRPAVLDIQVGSNSITAHSDNTRNDDEAKQPIIFVAP